MPDISLTHWLIFKLKNYFIFDFVYVCFSVYEFMHRSAGTYRGQKWTLNPLELEFQAVVM